MNIGEICVRDVVICPASTPVVEAARLMRERHVGDLVVVEERNNRRVPVGLITDRDIAVEVVALNAPLEKLTIGDIMGGNLATVSESEDVFRTLELMRRKSVRRLPVVDHRGALVGVIAMDDLLEILAEELTLMVKLIARQPTQEARSRPTLSPDTAEAAQ